MTPVPFRLPRAVLAGILLPFLPTHGIADPGEPAPEPPASWTFVSMPDFINVDTTYPQPGWEDALGFILDAVKAENPDFLLVAGDLLMGRWWSEEKIDALAATYYPAWTRRLEAHGITFYAAIGDHELGDNPWPPARAALVPRFKAAFRDHLQMPLNGPPTMKGTAYWFVHKNVLFVSVDVFEPGKGRQGGIVAQVTGEQLAWFEKTLADHAGVDHVVVMGHTPVLGPVRAWSSSRLMLEGGRESPFWQALAARGAALYLCGEVHAITCTERDGVWQIAHGGLLGYNTRTNYLVVRVSPDRIALELKEIDVEPSGGKLWQEGTNRPLERVIIPAAARAEGFVPVGRLVIDTRGGAKRFVSPAGWFEKRHEPSQAETYRPFGAGAPPRVRLR